MSADLASPTATCHGAVTSSTESGRIVIVLCGEIDLVVDALVDSRELLSSSGVRVAVVDMAETTFIDSSGINLLLKLRRSTDELGMTLTIVNVPPVVMTSLQCCGLFEHFGINGT